MNALTNLFSNARKFANVLRGDRHEEIEYDFSDSDLDEQEPYYNVESKKDLPVTGSSKLIYRTLDDMLLWTWKRNAYTEYNPYAFGVTQEFNEVVPEVLQPQNFAVLDVDNRRVVLQDNQQLRSMSIEQVKEGGDARLAMVYNIEAFREDIRVITALKIPFETMVDEKKDRPYFKNSQKQNTLDNWFYQNHSALSLLLRSTCRSETHIDKHMLDGINKKGAHIYWDDKTNNAKFKDGEFEVNL